MNIFGIRRVANPVARMSSKWAFCVTLLLGAISCFQLLILTVTGATVGIVDVFMHDILNAKYYGLIAAAAAYGLLRAGIFHPVDNKAYRQWLALTPWTPAKPFPRGPVHLIWADLLYLAFITCWLIFIVPSGSPFTTAMTPTVATLAAYALGTLTWMRKTERQERSLVQIALGGLLLPGVSIGLALTLLVLLYLVTWRALIKSLPSFPWNMDDEKTAKNANVWPWCYIGPELLSEKSWKDQFRQFLLPLAICCWWVFCLASRAIALDPKSADAAGFARACYCAAALVAIATPLVRWMIYCGKYRPPISLWGRLWTGHCIIPNYDRVLIPVFFLFMIGIIDAGAMFVLSVPPPVCLAVTLLVMIGAAYLLPPSLQQWELTGQYSVVLRSRPPQIGSRRAKR